jgi:hypothetical protein
MFCTYLAYSVLNNILYCVIIYFSASRILINSLNIRIFVMKKVVYLGNF